MEEEMSLIPFVDVAQIVNREIKTTYTTRDMFIFAADKKLRLLCYAPGLPLRIPNYESTYHFEGLKTRWVEEKHHGFNRMMLISKVCMPDMWSCFSPANDRIKKYPGKYFNPAHTQSGERYLEDMAEHRSSIGIRKIYADPHHGLSEKDYEQYSDEELEHLDDLHGEHDVFLYQNTDTLDVAPFDLQPALFNIVRGVNPADWGYQEIGFKPDTAKFFVDLHWLEYFINDQRQAFNSITIKKRSATKVKPKLWKPGDYGLPTVFAKLEPDANFWRNKKVTKAKRASYISWQNEILSKRNEGRKHGEICKEIAASEGKSAGTIIAQTYSVRAIARAGEE